MEEAVKKADVLIEALPYIKNFRNKTFVVKYGGSILSEEKVRKSVLEDIVFLYFMGINVVLVHGGGPNISEKLRSLNIPSRFHQGIRVTDKKTLEVVEAELMVLNSMLEKELKDLGADSLGINASEDILYVEKKKSDKDVGFVGSVVSVNKEKLKDLLGKEHLIVLAPMGSFNGEKFNVNADEAACFIAGELKAEKLVLLTNVKGIMRNVEDEDSLISSAKEEDIKKMIEEGIISEGMIPKVLAAVKALDSGTEKVHIIDAKIPHALLLEIFTDKGIGTEIVR